MPARVRAGRRADRGAGRGGRALIDRATIDAVELALRGIPREHYAYLGVILGLFLLQVVAGRLARSRMRRRAQADAESAIPALEAALRRMGLSRYGMRWSHREPAVVLEVWGPAGRFEASAFGRSRHDAILRALARIIESMPEAEPVGPPQGDGAHSGDRGDGRARERSGTGRRPDAPPPERWYEVLGLEPGATRADVDRAWRRLAKDAHPDRGGSAERMSRLNVARDEARASLGTGGYASGSV